METIGTTIVSEGNLIRYRCTYLDNSGDTSSTKLYEDYATAKKWFDDFKEALGDVHLMKCLLDSEENCIDEEVIDSYWDGATGL